VFELELVFLSFSFANLVTLCACLVLEYGEFFCIIQLLSHLMMCEFVNCLGFDGVKVRKAVEFYYCINDVIVASFYFNMKHYGN
jgi:hypothetical protein